MSFVTSRVHGSIFGFWLQLIFSVKTGVIPRSGVARFGPSLRVLDFLVGLLKCGAIGQYEEFYEIKLLED